MTEKDLIKALKEAVEIYRRFIKRDEEEIAFLGGLDEEANNNIIKWLEGRAIGFELCANHLEALIQIYEKDKE